ncbi:MAG: flagellar hook-length control protein FliK [Bosea sp. (in: a-proteobacteria)]
MPVNVVAAIQSQMLQTLLQAMQSADQQLKAGQMVEAKFMGWSGISSKDVAENGKPSLSEALVQIGGKPTALLIEATPERQARMQPGTILTLHVDNAASEGNPATLRLIAIQPPRVTPSGPGAQVNGGATLQGTLQPTKASVSAPEAARVAAGPIVGAALARQNGLGPLFADLDAMVRAPAPLPASVASAAALVLGLRTDADAIEGQPATLKAAVETSGLLHEAMLAKGKRAEASHDLKGALIVLRQTLRDALASLDVFGGSQAPADNEDAATARQLARTLAQITTDLPGSARPPAPTRDGLPVPQAMSAPSIVASDSAATMMTKALERTEGAIDRLSISQFASLPAASDASQGVPTNRWFTELPLALNGQTAVLPLEIEEDHGGGAANGPQGKLWRVRFALDVEPMGPLHAMVTLQGRAIGVTVWAERDATSQLVRDHAPDLKAALLDNDFDNPQIEVLAGQPMKRASHAGHYLDRRS